MDNSSEVSWTMEPEKNNYALGLLGAILGVILGSVVWIILYQMDIIAGLAGFAISICAVKGYFLLGGKLSKVGFAIIIITIILGVLFAECAGLTIYWMRHFDCGVSDAINSIIDALAYSEFASAIGKDLMFGYLFTAIASVGYLKKLK